MIINSGTIGMQSSRTSRSITQVTARSIGGTFMGGKEGLNSFFENQLGTGEKNAGEEGDKDKANLEDLSAHMNNMTGGIFPRGMTSRRQCAQSSSSAWSF